MKRLKRPAVPVAVAVLAVAVSACGGGGSGSTSGGDNSTTSETTTSETSSSSPEGGSESLPAGPVAKVEPKTVGYVAIAAKSAPIEETSAEAVEAAGKALGWNVKVRDAAGDPAKVVAAIQAFANEHVDALMVSSLTLEGAQRAAAQLKQSGAPIIEIGGEVPPSPEFTAQYSESETELAKLLAEKVIEDNPDGAKIGNVELSVAYSTKKRSDALEEAIDASDSGSEILANSDFDLTNPVQSTQDAVANMLLAHPDINAIWTNADISLLPALAAIEAKRSDAKAYSFYSDPSTLEAMHEGKPVGAITDVNFAVMPLLALDQLLGFFEKKTPIDPKALTPEMLEYSIVDPENVPPEGQVVYPLAKTLQPFLEKWESEYPLG